MLSLNSQQTFERESLIPIYVLNIELSIPMNSDLSESKIYAHFIRTHCVRCEIMEESAPCRFKCSWGM